MSDFDKEAEREKLRKKYEREQEDRKATQRMSDLLLKGATMTNTHCGTCGDPLFSQDGVNFCPSCHGGPQGVEASVPDESPDQRQPPAAETNAGTDSSAPPTAESPSDSEPADLDVTQTTADGSSVPQRSPDATDTTPSAPTPQTPATGSNAGADSPSAGTSLESARGSLHRALERFAAEAASTDDPRHAKECLEAAHEAAQTLSALRH